MSIGVPHVKTVKNQPKQNDYSNNHVSAYDIILGKVEIDTDLIPQYM